jgi:hypothetical protein
MKTTSTVVVLHEGGSFDVQPWIGKVRAEWLKVCFQLALMIRVRGT